MSNSSTGFSTGTYGEGAYGEGAYGGPIEPQLQLVAAIAIRENVVQLQFSEAIYISNILDVPDGSVPGRYAVQNVLGTVGLDGTSTRPVRVVTAAYSEDVPAGGIVGAYIDVTLDRPMTPSPSQYKIMCNGLFTEDLTKVLDPSASTITFEGLFKQIVVPDTTAPTPSRDFANPQTFGGAVGTTPNPASLATLGVFMVDDSGDYALDQGLVAYKKRIFRRLQTVPGGFVHLGDSYGVGLTQQGKKLAKQSVLQGLAALAETQIAQEPETERVKVQPTLNTNAPGLVYMNILAKMKGGGAVKFTAAFPIAL